MVASVFLVVGLLRTTSTHQIVFAPGVVSTDMIEYGATFSPSGDSVYFTRRASFEDPPMLWFAQRDRTGNWGGAMPVAFSGGAGDEYPSLSPDGNRLYFAYKRALTAEGVPRQENALWRLHRSEAGWADPEPLRVDGLGDAMASHPVEASDGSLFFHARLPGGPGRVDAYQSPASGDGFGTPQLLSFNSPAVDGEVVVWPSLDRLVFYSDRDGGVGGGDLYVVHRVGPNWGEPINIGPPVNTSLWEWTPSLSADGTRLIFARLDQSFERSDILVIDVSEVPTLTR